MNVAIYIAAVLSLTLTCKSRREVASLESSSDSNRKQNEFTFQLNYRTEGPDQQSIAYLRVLNYDEYLQKRNQANAFWVAIPLIHQTEGLPLTRTSLEHFKQLD